MLASATQTPEIALTDTEAKQLAGAIVNVSKHYPVYVNEKTQAWMGLFMVAGSLYAPRVVTLYMKSNSPQKPQETATVHPFPVPNQPLPN